jgi:hypothetical protein
MRVRKLPVEVDARQAMSVEFIDTPEGIMKAKPGDWIVTGIAGERYPVKPEIFLKTYEVIG